MQNIVIGCRDSVDSLPGGYYKETVMTPGSDITIKSVVLEQVVGYDKVPGTEMN